MQLSLTTFICLFVSTSYRSGSFLSFDDLWVGIVIPDIIHT